MFQIKPQDKRNDIFKKFDGCMEDFFAGTTRFCEEVERITKSDEDKTKVHLLAMGLMMDLQILYHNAKIYYDEIKYSMLDIRIDKNLEHMEAMEKKLVDFRFIIDNEIKRGKQRAENEETENLVVSHKDDNSSTDIILYTSGLSRDLSYWSLQIFEKIAEVVKYIDDMLFDLTRLNLTRDDKEFGEIYNRCFEKYISSDKWLIYRDNYLQNIIQDTFDGRIENMTSQSFDAIIKNIKNKIHDEEELDNVWVSCGNSVSATCKYFIGLKLNDDILINTYFKYVALIDYINEEKKNFEMKIIKVGEGSLLADSVQFIKPYSEDRFALALNDIQIYMDNNGMSTGYWWCCLHHALAFDRRINNVDFRTFMRWLMDFVGDDNMISEDNISQYTSNYFVVTTNRMWSLKDYKDYIEAGKDVRRIVKSTKQVNKHFYIDKNVDTFNKLFKASEKMRQILRKYS